MSVAIIDYGMGNVESVKKAFLHLNIPSIITSSENEIKEAKYVVLPGVGAFAQGIENLKRANLFELLNNEVLINKKPFLGICLGMQLIADKGFEPYECEGFGWIRGNVVKIEEELFSIPHMGWNEISILKKDYITDECDNKDFYFIHSYHFDVKDESAIVAKVKYGKDYVAVIHKDNIFATQFHPEKSQVFGLKILNKFVQFYA